MLCALYVSEISVSICISSLWDEGWEVKLGDTVHGFVADKTFLPMPNSIRQLTGWRSRQLSKSDFARRFTQFRSAKKSLGRVSRG